MDNKTWCSLILAAIVLAMGGCAGGPQLTPITDATKRIEVSGFSVLPPRGNDWYFATAPEGVIVFNKRLNSRRPEPNTAIAYVATTNVGTRRFQTREEFLAWVRKQESDSTTRMQTVKSEVVLDPSRGPWCARVVASAEDREVPMFPGKTFTTHNQSYWFVHPHWQDCVINVVASQRIIEGDKPLLLDSEYEPFLGSIQFTDARPKAAIQLPQ